MELAPELREVLEPVQTLPQATESARASREEVLEGLGGELLEAHEGFLGGLTLEEYREPPDREWARLWIEWDEEQRSGGAREANEQ